MKLSSSGLEEGNLFDYVEVVHAVALKITHVRPDIILTVYIPILNFMISFFCSSVIVKASGTSMES